MEEYWTITFVTDTYSMNVRVSKEEWDDKVIHVVEDRRFTRYGVNRGAGGGTLEIVS